MSSKPSPRTSIIPHTPTTPGGLPIHPRPLRPIHPHPQLGTIQAPVLPTPQRPAVFHTTKHGVYRLSTHLVPAAYPRSTPDVPLPVIPAYIPGGSSERQAKMDALVTEVREAQDVYVDGKLGGEGSEKLLWNCVNRYVRAPVRSGNGITLFLAHANGFHKETWETMLRGLLDASAGEMIDEVWAWDAVQHGDAAVVNTENQNGIFDWLDNARDIINFLVHYLPEHVDEMVLPTRLQHLPGSVTKQREERGYDARKLVVVGHSFGGCTSLRVAFDYPKLFSSFVLVDPVIVRPYTYRPSYLHSMVLGAFTRRDHWSSREEALELFGKSQFFGAWHPDVLRHYADYALADDPEGGVKLKMSGLQEGLSFANQVPAWEVWMLLDKLDENIALRWVIPDLKSLTTREGAHERVWRRPANSTNVVFHFAGHLIVQEAPFELAHDISDYLLRMYGSSKVHL